MPFPFQRGGVPNQMGLNAPQNAQGLGVGGGRAMFNLPRFQMPGTSINFGGTQSANEGGQPFGNVGVNFSIRRQASSDPIKNIIGDIGNPLDNTQMTFSPAAPAPQAPQGPSLRSAMVNPNDFDPFRDTGMMGFGPTSPSAWGSRGNMGFGPTSGSERQGNFNPFTLRHQMIGFI